MQEQLSAQSVKGHDQRDAILMQQERKLLALLGRFFRAVRRRSSSRSASSTCCEPWLACSSSPSCTSARAARRRPGDSARRAGRVLFVEPLQSPNGDELNNFEFISEEIKRSHELLQKLTKDMQDAFLSRPIERAETHRRWLQRGDVEFVAQQLPASLPELAHEVIQPVRQRGGKAYGYKITQGAFPRFRAAFERRVMVSLRLVRGRRAIRRLPTRPAPRARTPSSSSQPEIFSMIVGEIASGSYEYL